ncbi:MAG: hypothetical protein J0H34_08025 [Rhizobiales bacterium]|nr:hypothetical protein [Hyphomicrobiales bacterium]
MLARRFTIVCLMLTLFAMFFASLAAQPSRAGRNWDRQAAAIPCSFDPSLTCGYAR